MPEFGTPAFNEAWRRSGFFAAAQQKVLLGATEHTILTGLTRESALAVQADLAEMRDELTKIQAAVDRVAHNMQPGVSGGRVDPLQLEHSLVALGGWIASAVQTLGAMSYYLSEPGLMKVNGFLKPQVASFESHMSRKFQRSEGRRPTVRKPVLR